MGNHYLWSGLASCWDTAGHPVDCAGSRQDADFQPGHHWPEPRFADHGELIVDLGTGLTWTRNANPMDFPATWSEALDFVRRMNARATHGHTDWRMPNRRELRSLISHAARKPALPANHPFRGVFLGWYWTCTTSALAPAYAWYVHMEGGRMFYGRKDQYCLLWPVRGKSSVLPATGQTICYDEQGREIACSGSLQDGEFRAGVAWPSPRFTILDSGVRDELTGLVWTRSADLAGNPVTWKAALDLAADLAARDGLPWRLPSINELESLVDASRHSPALPAGHPFEHVPEACWSSSTSFFEPDWAYCLYFHKGAVGVGYKPNPEFAVWLVRDE